MSVCPCPHCSSYSTAYAPFCSWCPCPVCLSLLTVVSYFVFVSLIVTPTACTSIAYFLKVCIFFSFAVFRSRRLLASLVHSQIHSYILLSEGLSVCLSVCLLFSTCLSVFIFRWTDDGFGSMTYMKKLK